MPHGAAWAPEREMSKRFQGPQQQAIKQHLGPRSAGAPMWLGLCQTSWPVEHFGQQRLQRPFVPELGEDTKVKVILFGGPGSQAG